MTLRDKFGEVYIEKGMEKELEQIADDYAVEFLNWYIRKSSIMDKKYIGITSEELLEIFKKEKETNSNKVV